MVYGSLFELDVKPSLHFHEPIAKSHSLVFVHLAFLFDVAGEGVGLWKENGLLESPDLGADEQQLQNVISRRWSIALHAQHLQSTALLALAGNQYLQYQVEIVTVTVEVIRVYSSCGGCGVGCI